MSDIVISKSRATGGGCGCGGHGHGGCNHDRGEEKTPPRKEPEQHSCGCRGIRTQRRWHAALGAAFILFLLFHFAVAALGWFPRQYEATAIFLHGVTSRFPAIEVALYAGLGVQALLGLWLLHRSGLKYRSSRCREDGTLRYFLQRWSAVVLLVFLAVHLAMVEWRMTGPSLDKTREALLAGNPFLIIFYAVAILAAAFHAANGLWTGASVWGVRERYRRAWLSASIATGILLAGLGGAALRAFSTYPS